MVSRKLTRHAIAFYEINIVSMFRKDNSCNLIKPRSNAYSVLHLSFVYLDKACLDFALYFSNFSLSHVNYLNRNTRGIILIETWISRHHHLYTPCKKNFKNLLNNVNKFITINFLT